MKILDKIIEKRYVIALIALIILTVFGLTGSSMGAISAWILEPEMNNTLLGVPRAIRSDEYGVETLISASQKASSINSISNLIGENGKDMLVAGHSPVCSLFTIFRIYNIAYLFLNFNMAFSFAWNLKLIALILATFELFQIITKNKKYISFCGTIIVALSSFVAWWDASDLLIFGQLIVISIYKFMQSKEFKQKLLWTIVFTYSFISYIFSLYPAWIVSFGYVFMALGLWIILDNFKEYKSSKKYFILAIISIVILGIFGFAFFNNSKDAILQIINTSYPGARNENGGRGVSYLFSYGYSFLLPFVQTEDNMVYSSILSFFPIPLVLGMVYLYKKEKHANFLLPMLIVLCLETVWTLSGMPNIIAKITLLNVVPVERAAVAISLGCVYLYIYMIAHIEENFINMKNVVRYTLLFLVVYFLINRPYPLETSKKYMYGLACSTTIGYFLLLNSTDKKYKKLFLGTAVIWTICSFWLVNPITLGTKVVTETKLAKAIQNEIKNDNSTIWITEDMDMVVTNYLVAQGAKTLNATAFYPDTEFWQKVLKDKAEEYKEIWNRYAHIRVMLTEEESSVSLFGDDRIILNLNIEEINELGINYIVSYKDIDEFEISNLQLTKIYENKNLQNIEVEGKNVSGIYIYKNVN